MNRQNLAIDYCPFCCVDHVIGEHPGEHETEAQYWARMEARELASDRERLAAGWQNRGGAA